MSRSGDGRAGRLLLSTFFVLHWGAVVAYLLPATRDSLADLPATVRVPAQIVFPRLVQNTLWVTEPYLDLTATRQSWAMFAPDPADWTGTVKVVPYFPIEGDPERWLADTLVVHGAREYAFPHFLDHRVYRVLNNLALDSFADDYRPLFAQEMCASLRDERGAAPDGVVLLLDWIDLVPAWADREAEEHRQWLGGYDCSAASRAAGRAPFPRYGLPAPVATSGWSPVRLDSNAPDSAAGAQPGGRGRP